MHSTIENSNSTHSVKIPGIVYAQGDRIVYSTSFSFELASHLETSDFRDSTSEGLTVSDILDLENRYLNRPAVNELVTYAKENKHNYILPAITLNSEKFFKITPIAPSLEKINEIRGEEISDVQLRYSLHDILSEVGGQLGVIIEIPYSYFASQGDVKPLITVADGNHRCKMIEILMSESPESIEEWRNAQIGVTIFVEPNKNERKKNFVLLNSSTPVQSSVKGLFMQNDILSEAVKHLAGLREDNSRFFIKQLNDFDVTKNIGFEPVDNVGANSKKVLSFNILKNMVAIMGTNSQNPKSFTKKYSTNTLEELDIYRKLLADCKTFFEHIFDLVEPFKLVQGNLDRIPELKKSYLSLSGAGLYVIAHVGHECRELGYNLSEVARILAQLDWHKLDGSGVSNSFFEGTIVSSDGGISNTRVAIKPAVERLMRYVTMELNNSSNSSN